MFDLLDIAEDRRRRRLAEAAAERLSPQSHVRHSLAMLLRRTADRLDQLSGTGSIAPSAIVHAASSSRATQ
jgi:hypothetical protein